MRTVVTLVLIIACTVLSALNVWCIAEGDGDAMTYVAAAVCAVGALVNLQNLR